MDPLAALISIPSNLGYLTVVVLVMAESGGVPVPGETALIAAGVLAQQGKLNIVVVIALAAVAAIVGDNIGFLVSRRFGRGLLERPGLWEEHRRAALERGEGFFERHGSKAVFFGRWITGLRTWASWLAGITGMHWATFFFWNALGGIAWATTIGLASYLLGSAAAHLIETVGIGAAIAVGLVAVAAFVFWRLRRRGNR